MLVTGLPNFNNEMKLLLACTKIGGLEWQNIHQLLQKQHNGKTFLNLIERHRLLPAIYHNLRNIAPTSFSIRALTCLNARFRSNAMAGMVLTAELAHLAKLFGQKGIPFLTLKGPCLALQLYGDPSLRHAGDLDIIIGLNDIERVSKLLVNNGYHRTKPAFTLKGSKKTLLIKFGNHICFSRNNIQVSIEVHWHWNLEPNLFPLSFEEALKNSQILSIAGIPLRILSDVDNLLFLTTHGAGHAWHRLFWLLDIANFLKKISALDFHSVIERAQMLGVTRPLIQGLILSSLLFGTDLSDEIKDYYQQDEKTQKMVKQVLQSFSQPLRSSIFQLAIGFSRIRLYQMNLCGDMRHKLRWLLKSYMYSGDLGIKSFPDVLLPVYFISRPFLWYWRWFFKGEHWIE